MRLLLILALLTFVISASTSCAVPEAEWAKAEPVAKEFFAALQKKDFKGAYNLHREGSLLRSKYDEATYVERFSEGVKEIPSLCDFEYSLTQVEGFNTRGGVYKFNVALKWAGGYPLAHLDESELPLLAEEMTILIKRDGDRFQVSAVQPKYNLHEEAAKKSGD